MPGAEWRSRPDWRRARRQAYRRARGQCEQCWQPDDGLVVHHLWPVAEGGPIADLDNLVAICRECHAIAHKHRPARRLTPEEQAWRDLIDRQRREVYGE